MNHSALGALPGAFVMSLDFELHWGVREKHRPDDRYAANLHGAREVIPRLLDLFEEFQVAATWATVGFLFTGSSEELRRASPVVRPSYRDSGLDPYNEPVGASEETDPLHFAPTLIRRIQRTPRQEIATHTYSHFYCGEDGATPDAFRADLDAAIDVARRFGVQLRSVVFPRNQHTPAFDPILLACGIRAYRGNPRSRMWRFRGADESRRIAKRGGRLLDSYVGPARPSTTAWEEVLQPSGLSDVRSNALLRPYRPSLRHLESLRLDRIARSLSCAARSRRLYHLWWHPHNFGVDQDENLRFLRRVLEKFSECRARHGMQSLSMVEADSLVRSPVEPDDAHAAAPARPLASATARR